MAKLPTVAKIVHFKMIYTVNFIVCESYLVFPKRKGCHTPLLVGFGINVGQIFRKKRLEIKSYPS